MGQKSIKEKQFKEHMKMFFTNRSNLKDKIIVLNLVLEGAISSYKIKPGHRKHPHAKMLKVMREENGKRHTNAFNYLRVMRNDITHMNPGFDEAIITLRGLNSDEALRNKFNMLMEIIDEEEVIENMYLYWIMLYPEDRTKIPEFKERIEKSNAKGKLRWS